MPPDDGIQETRLPRWTRSPPPRAEEGSDLQSRPGWPSRRRGGCWSVSPRWASPVPTMTAGSPWEFPAGSGQRGCRPDRGHVPSRDGAGRRGDRRDRRLVRPAGRSGCGSSTRSSPRTGCARSRPSATVSPCMTPRTARPLALLTGRGGDDLPSHLTADHAERLRAELAEIRAGTSRSTATSTPRAFRPPGWPGGRAAVFIVAISVPAPTGRFVANKERIVVALRSRPPSPAWLG